ncbi:MAG: cell division protein [Gemmatimonadetes bacterium]|nr:cell division protein [Gemmatimonadota bacterium]
MPVILLETCVRAPAERCFDLSRSVELHLHSSAATGEKAVGGVTRGMLGPGQQVTWRARHLGVTQHLTSRIVEYDRPTHFRDRMVRGAFARFDHDHDFEACDGGTLMRERFDYDAPLGVLGTLAERLFLTRYMRRFLQDRCETIKRIAESDEWRRFVPDEGTATG